MPEKMKKFTMPHTYAFLFGLIILMAIMTWVVPSGQFQKAEEELAGGMVKTVIIPGTFETVEKTPELRQSIFDVLMAPALGIIDAIDVIALMFIIGGFFAILLKTGSIDAVLSVVAKNLKGKEIFLIPIVVIIISIGGTTIGISEEIIPLFLVFAPLLIKFGYDSMTAVMMLFLASQVGYAASTLNPFSVLIAQSAAGIEGNPQLEFRFIQWIICTLFTIVFIMLYAKKVKKNPQKSIVYEDDLKNREYFMKNMADTDSIVMTKSQKLILAVFAGGIAFFAWGILKHGWYINELSAIFMGLVIITGIIAKMSANEIAETFVEGCKDFAYAALIIGIARAVLVVTNNGMIMDTILNSLANTLQGLPSAFYTTFMVFTENIITFFVPSSSGCAALTMPILGPLTELMGLSKEAAVTAYQYANATTNMLSPTGGVLMAGLAMTRINWIKWIKTVIPYVLGIQLLGIIFAYISANMPL